MFEEPFYWLILGSTLNKSLQLINDNSFGLSTDVVIAIYEDNNYILYDIYNPCKIHGGILNVTMLGTWNNKSGFGFPLKFEKMDRWNLRNMTLRISGLVRKNFIIFFNNS